MNHSADNYEDDEGWTIARCSCGIEWGPVPDAETATDVLMEHAYGAGVRAGQVGAKGGAA